MKNEEENIEEGIPHVKLDNSCKVK
jgi:hypothetical protein